jgi:mercuric reductase
MEVPQMASDNDILILGSGSTAFAAALRAQALGAKVAMIEKSVLGGTCINWGCIPSKTLIHAALFRREASLGSGIGLGLEEKEIDYDRLMAHKNDVVKYLRTTKYLDVLSDVPGLRLVKGTGRFIAPGTVEVGDETLSCDKILIATGGFPRVPDIPGLRGINYLTSREALLLKEFPASMIIIGGGVIALEMGQMLNRLGVKVTVLEHGQRLLHAVEKEPVMALQQVLMDEGMDIRLNVVISEVSGAGAGVTVTAEIDGRREELTAERLLIAVGTAPASSGIGLETVGVEVNGGGFIKVDEQMRTTAPGIWAAGDVIGGMMIATAGAREGIVAADNMLNPGCECRMDHLSTPMTIFTDPEVGLVGHTEASAIKAGLDIICNTLPVSAIPKSHVTGHTAGAIKMIADKQSRRLLGVHLSCHRGAELINEAALAIRFGATVEDLASALHVYPSMGEGLRLCAQGFTRDVTKLSCCAE